MRAHREFVISGKVATRVMPLAETTLLVWLPKSEIGFSQNPPVTSQKVSGTFLMRPGDVSADE